MARFTMTIQDIYQMYIWEDGVSLPDLLPETVMDYGTSKLFDFPYSVPVDKATFENAFNQRYYLKEIGFETVDIFKMKLNYTLNIKAPMYQTLYDGLMKNFSIRNVNTTTVNSQEDMSGNDSSTKRVNTSDTTVTAITANASGNDRVTGNQNANQTGVTNNTGQETNASNQSQIFSDTPDNRLNNLTINPNNDRFSLNYASSLQDVLVRANGTTRTDSRNTQTNAVTNIQDQRTTSQTSSNQNETVTGLVNDSTTAQQQTNKNINQTTTFQYSNDLNSYQQFQEVFKPILEMILNDLEVLFMGVF